MSFIVDCSISNKNPSSPTVPFKNTSGEISIQKPPEKAARATNNLLHSELVFAHPHKIHPKIALQSRKITD